MSERIIYTTGTSRDGAVLIGGIWTLWAQEGFPLEMSYMIARTDGWAIDWLEAMADASTTNNLPIMMDKVEAFLPSSVILHIKIGFMHALNGGQTYAAIVRAKRENGAAFEDFIRKALVAT